MNGAAHDHWQKVYRTGEIDRFSWHRDAPTGSNEALERLGAHSGQALIDIGAGARPLAVNLAKDGWRDLAVLDITEAALDHARSAAGDHAGHIDWIAADITQWQPLRRYDFWHDRAVFHFLTDPGDRAAYKRALAGALEPGSHAIIATFAPDGPPRCSGLEVQRYDAAALARELGDGFEPVDDWREAHTTPSGAEQLFTWAIFRRTPS